MMDGIRAANRHISIGTIFGRSAAKTYDVFGIWQSISGSESPKSRLRVLDIMASISDMCQ
jgi:hypothetical protein